MVAALDRAFPEPEFENWPRCESLLPHLFAVAPEAEDSLSLASLLDHGGWYLTERAPPRRGRAALAAGARHSRSGARCGAFRRGEVAQQPGQALPGAGSFEEGRAALRAFAENLRKHLEASHPDLVSSLNNLASVYRDQGRHGDAELLYRRSLAIFETAPAADHPDLAMSLNNLASLYQAQARHGEAEHLPARAGDPGEDAGSGPSRCRADPRKSGGPSTSDGHAAQSRAARKTGACHPGESVWSGPSRGREGASRTWPISTSSSAAAATRKAFSSGPGRQEAVRARNRPPQ